MTQETTTLFADEVFPYEADNKQITVHECTFLLLNHPKLTFWEHNFLESISEQLKRKKNLTDRQLFYYHKIRCSYDKYYK